MRGLHAEYLFKGIYLGLLLFVALHEPDWAALGWAALATLGGLMLFLGLAAYLKVREGYHVRGRPVAFTLFVLLESPELTYAGVIGGGTLAALLVRQGATDSRFLLAFIGGGAALGLLFGLLRHVTHRWTRLGLSLLLAAVLVAGVLFWLGHFGTFGLEFTPLTPLNRTVFGAQLLLGIPLFYLLAFTGREEESEVEIGAMCAALGLGLTMLTPHGGPQSLSFLLPIMLYFWYTTRVLPRLRVFKHAVRGYNYSQVGQHRQAILSFRRALQFDPRNILAREGLWAVHRQMDLSQLADDPRTLAVVDLEMCLERAGTLLLEPKPSEEKLNEANRLLDLLLTQRPDLRAPVHYWRAVAFTHARRYDEAAEELRQVLDPTGYSANDPRRRAILLVAWQLALRWHSELARRVGEPELAQPGRRMEAIAAVERHLAGSPEDPDVWGFKRVLYQDLTEAEYNAAVGPEGRAAEFDHGYTHQLGLALIGDAERWQRGAEYLRIAARGLAAQGPSIFAQIAQAYQRAGQGEEAWKYYEKAKQAGRSVGVKELTEDERQTYFAVVKLLGDAAHKHQQYDLAIENYRLYAESERSGLETLRTLADLYERKGDPLAALRVTEQALIYSGRDRDLLERKDRYYFSVLPDDLRARGEMLGSAFDVAYCLNKARALLDARNWDLDTLDWAQHLIELVRVVQPDSLAVKVLLARALLRRGEKEQAIALLEQVRSPKPEKFATSEDEEAWFVASKLLGEVYLYELNKPDLAVECFTDFRQSTKSGADTMYKLGQAYEQLGDPARAAKFYKHVLAFENHPLASDAHDALSRLQATS
jgi:tetratricopeptide (TPR) repeat protein